MKFAQNSNPTFVFGINEYTCLFGIWEYEEIFHEEKLPIYSETGNWRISERDEKLKLEKVKDSNYEEIFHKEKIPIHSEIGNWRISEKDKKKCIWPQKQARGEKQQQSKRNTFTLSKNFWLHCGALKYRTTSRLTM